MRRFIHIILLVLASTGVMAQNNKSCPVYKIIPEFLPELNIPRSGHSVILTGNEIVAIGGHTSGFVPTPTAEYYKDGEWHLINTVYSHDGGFTVPLKSGDFIIAGGFEKHLGIGQTYVVEKYHPQTHSFEGFGCMNTKRAMGVGLELENGRVVITGNWYHNDNIEIFDGHDTFTFVKEVTTERSLPHIFLTSPNNALIMGGTGTRDYPEKDPIDNAIVDRLKGDSLYIPLLKHWRSLRIGEGHYCDEEFIGEKEKGVYAYLFTVVDQDNNLAICQMVDSTFSLLPTTYPIPIKNKWGKSIHYISSVIADRSRQCGYVAGSDEENRQYILKIEYGKTPAPITLYYTDPMPEAGHRSPILTADGDLMTVGGINYLHNNFSPCSSVILYHFGTPFVESSKNTAWIWLYVLVGILLIACCGYLWVKYRRNNSFHVRASITNSKQPENRNGYLMDRLEQLMQEEKLYLRQGLKVSDAATLLDTSSRNVSNCIKQVKDINFNDYVNSYRVEHAKRLLEEHPEMKSEVVGLSSGFSSETSFYRAFRYITGKSPKEWTK